MSALSDGRRAEIEQWHACSDASGHADAWVRFAWRAIRDLLLDGAAVREQLRAMTEDSPQALKDAIGLVKSEANRWSSAPDRRTADHWDHVATVLGGRWLALTVMHRERDALRAQLAAAHTERDEAIKERDIFGSDIQGFIRRRDELESDLAAAQAALREAEDFVHRLRLASDRSQAWDLCHHDILAPLHKRILAALSTPEGL